MYVGGSFTNTSNNFYVAAYSLPVFISTKNGNWNDPATWSNGMIPPPDAKVVIRNIVTITTDATCYSIHLEPGGKVVVNSGVNFTVLH